MQTSELKSVRVDHIGSLMRPPELQQIMLEFIRGQRSEETLRDVEDTAIREVLRKQAAHKMPIVTDGEFRRRTYLDSVGQSVAGLAGWRRAWAERFLEEFEARERGVQRTLSLAADREPATDRLDLTHNLPLDEFTFAAPLAQGTLKCTVLSPYHAAQFVRVPGGAYDSADQVLDDLTIAEHKLVQQLADAGCKYVQLDAASYVGFLDPKYREALHGQDIAARVDQAIAAENRVIADLEGVVTGLHICRGNRPGSAPGEGAYDAIAERVFSQATFDRLLLEYDTERAGGFEPLRFVPRGKIAVLGLVSTKSARLETRDELMRRIEEASRFLPIEQLAISPQCGFSSNVWGPPMTEDDQWRKLDVLNEVAAEAWPASAAVTP